MSAVVVGFVARVECLAALRSAVEEADRRGSHLVVVNSAPGRADSGIAPAVAELLGDSGVDWEFVQLEERFDAAEDLLEAAETHDAELIVIGLRRRSPIQKLILGSTAERVLLDAGCPVLAVPPEEPAP